MHCSARSLYSGSRPKKVERMLAVGSEPLIATMMKALLTTE